MRTAITFLVIASLLAACAESVPSISDRGSIAVVPSPYEPAAQLAETGGGLNSGAVVGAAGGAAIGAASAQASAGLLCTVGGPLCLIAVIPAAIVGGLVGGVTGGVVDAVTADPGNRIAKARSAVQHAVADMRLTDAVATQTRLRASQARIPAVLSNETDYRALAAKGFGRALEVEATDLQFLPREKEMALALRVRSRLYRTSDGHLLDERVSEAQTDFRRYTDWAADDAQPLRRAMDTAVAELARSIVGEQLAASASQPSVGM